jgi:hypothetical protein
MWVKTSRQIASEFFGDHFGGRYVVSNNEDNRIELEYVETLSLNNVVSKTITMDAFAAEAISRLLLIAASEARAEEAKENAMNSTNDDLHATPSRNRF